MNNYYKDLKAAIAEQIKPNDNEEITGQIMQDVLLSMVSHLGAGQVYGGIATPTTPLDSSPQGAVFYLATERGTYSSFSGIVVDADDGEVVILSYDPSLDVWAKDSLSITLSAGSVGTAQLADNAVTVAKVADDVWTQIAAMISPVKTTADNAADTAATAKTTAEAAQTAVADMQIGGVNYINATNQGISYWAVYQGAATGWTTEEAELLGARGAKMSGSNGGAKLIYYYPIANMNLGYMYDVLQDGDDVVLSCDVATANINQIRTLFCPSTGSATRAAITFDTPVIQVSGDGIAHCEWHGRVTSYIAEHASLVYMHIYPRVAADPMSITIVNLKLEKGTKATSWTPSQVDLDNRLQDVSAGKVSYTSAQSLTADQQATARTNIAAMANTPSGDPMHYMYELLGASWNASTNMWAIDYLTDITTAQMRLIYLWRNSETVPVANQRFRVPSDVRVIVNMNAESAQGTMRSMFQNCAGAELITFRTGVIAIAETFTSTFYGCSKLEVITGDINLRLCTTAAGVSSAFTGCTKLREVRITGLNTSGLNLSASEVLSAASVRYLVENAINTAPITVYVSTGTLDDITEQPIEWEGIWEMARDKQITFEVPTAAATALDDPIDTLIE